MTEGKYDETWTLITPPEIDSTPLWDVKLD
jgi:hypothetical protein